MRQLSALPPHLAGGHTTNPAMCMGAHMPPASHTCIEHRHARQLLSDARSDAKWRPPSMAHTCGSPHTHTRPPPSGCGALNHASQRCCTEAADRCGHASSGRGAAHTTIILRHERTAASLFFVHLTAFPGTAYAEPTTPHTRPVLAFTGANGMPRHTCGSSRLHPPHAAEGVGAGSL